MWKSYGAGVLSLFFFLYLLLYPAKSLDAVRSGMLLWYRSVLPVLFPFMILSGIVTRLHLTEHLPKRLLTPVCRLFGCSVPGSFAVLAGFLCGFPIGARMTLDLQKQHLISRQEAEHLYGFANNVSPAFLISFVAHEQLAMPRYRPLFLFSVLGASALYGALTAPRRPSPQSLPRESALDSRAPSVSFAVLDACIQDAVAAAVKLGAYITVFSLLGSVAGQLFSGCAPCAAAVSGFLEITNGVASVVRLKLSAELKAVWLCGLCAFGGLSAFAQTVSIAEMGRQTAFRYIKSRVTITLLACIMSLGILVLRRLLFL